MADGDTEQQEIPTEVIVKLSKPVMAHGDMVSELKFRMPTGADIEIAGHPVTMEWTDDDMPKFVPVERKMTAMMARLAGVPPSTIKSMTSNDWTNCYVRLLGFFVPRLTT